jgi:hypothetical protein
MTPEPSNQREFTRVVVNCAVTIMADHRPIECSSVHTLSMKGMLAPTHERLPEGMECEITISLVEHEIEINLMGIVVRNLPEGIAFQFTKIMGPESYAHLRNLVLYNATDTDQVEQEFENHSGLRKKDPE